MHFHQLWEELKKEKKKLCKTSIQKLDLQCIHIKISLIPNMKNYIRMLKLILEMTPPQLLNAVAAFPNME